MRNAQELCTLLNKYFFCMFCIYVSCTFPSVNVYQKFFVKSRRQMMLLGCLQFFFCFLFYNFCTVYDSRIKCTELTINYCRYSSFQFHLQSLLKKQELLVIKLLLFVCQVQYVFIHILVLLDYFSFPKM